MKSYQDGPQGDSPLSEEVPYFCVGACCQTIGCMYLDNFRASSHGSSSGTSCNSSTASSEASLAAN